VLLQLESIMEATYSTGNTAASTPGFDEKAALPEDPWGMGCSADCSNSASDGDDAAALPDDPWNMCCSADDSDSDSNKSSSLLQVSGTELVCENIEQLSDDGPGTPGVVSVAASCAASARPSCDEAGDIGSSSSSSGGNVQPAAGSKQQQQHVKGKGGVLRGVAGRAVPFKLLLTATVLLCKLRCG
jgi:hypothetical protein